MTADQVYSPQVWKIRSLSRHISIVLEQIQIKYYYKLLHQVQAWLAQSVEHETLNLRVVGSSPTLGEIYFLHFSLKLSSILEGSISCLIVRQANV